MTTGICAVTGCTRTIKARGWCPTHYQRWLATGDPGQEIRAVDPMATAAPYVAAHQKVRDIRGHAREHPCEHCASPAEQWAYDHADPDERVDRHRTSPGTLLRFSDDPTHYLPLCRPCHTRFDQAWRARRVARRPRDHVGYPQARGHP